MKQTMTINGVIFEVGKPDALPVIPNRIKGKTIWEAYGKPSPSKVQAWYRWCHWCAEINSQVGQDCNIWIESATSWIFTITGVYSCNDVDYNIHITPSHNYVYPVIR